MADDNVASVLSAQRTYDDERAAEYDDAYWRATVVLRSGRRRSTTAYHGRATERGTTARRGADG